METLLFCALALVVFGAVWKLLTRSVSLTDETTRSLELQVGARNLLENLVEDVNSAHVVLDPPGDVSSTLALLKYVKADAKDRLDLNNRPMYPFAETDGQTIDKLNCLRTTYRYDDQKKEVLRTVETGLLACSDEQATPGFFTKYDFQADKEIYHKVLATNVALFSLAYGGYTTEGEPVPVEDLPKPSYPKTSFLLVRLKTVFDEGLYGPGSLRRRPTVDIYTKIWSYKRISDLVYQEYFSSADEDARF